MRLAALLPPDPAVARSVAERLRLSRAEAKRLADLLVPPAATLGAEATAVRAALYRQETPVLSDQLRLDWARRDPESRARRRPDLEGLLTVADRWEPVKFPLKGRDATALGIAAGPRVGELLSAVEDWWVGEDFAPDRAACLAKLRELARS